MYILISTFILLYTILILVFPLTASNVPTAAPTGAPSAPPSSAPSLRTLPPSLAPSRSPSLPSLGPSLSPTFTLAPSFSPSSSPSLSPTLPPSLSPSWTPSSAPTQPPSESPSGTPSSSPTSVPSSPPTSTPSSPPTQAPTLTPTQPPSNAPSNPPTNNPIASDDFDYFLEITYVLKAVNDDDKQKIAYNPLNVTHDIESVIKNEYVADDPNHPISYDFFLIDIQRIQDIDIAEIDALTAITWTNVQSLELQTLIECNEYGCASIKEQSKEGNDFAKSVNTTLQTYFGNDNLQFDVKEDAAALEIISKYADETTPTLNPSYPTTYPSVDPSTYPSTNPTMYPIIHPTVLPTVNPTMHPTVLPTTNPTVGPTSDPTSDPTAEPTREPTVDPTVEPTSKPTVEPTVEPTLNPTLFEATATYLTAFAPEAARNTVPVQLLLVISLIVCTFIVAVQCFLFKKRTHPKNNQKTASNPKEYQSLWTWLTRKVKLPEYYGNFVDNGYQNMLSILDLKHESQLSEIGIHNVEHRIRILSNIEELRKIAYHEMENKLLHIQSMNPQTSEELPPLPRSLSASPNIFQLDGEIRGENYHRMMTNIEAFIQNLDGEDSFEDHETHGQTKGSESVDGVNVIYAEDDEPGKASESDSLDEIYVKGEASVSEDKECVVKDEEEYDVNGAMHMITTKDKEESIHSKQSQVIKYWEYETSR